MALFFFFPEICHENSSLFLPFTGDWVLAAFGFESENKIFIAVIPAKLEGYLLLPIKNQKKTKEVVLILYISISNCLNGFLLNICISVVSNFCHLASIF